MRERITGVSRVDWGTVSEEMREAIQREDLDRAWEAWSNAFARQLKDTGQLTEASNPGTIVWSKRSVKACLTLQGQEDEVQMQGAKVARRLRDFAQTHAGRESEEGHHVWMGRACD